MKYEHKVENRRDAGFSLIELLVSMILFLVITGAIFSTMQIAQRSRAVVNEKVESTKALRFAVKVLGRDTYNAGFGYPLRNTVVLPDNRLSTLLELPPDYDTSRDTIPPIIAANNIRDNNFSIPPGTRTDQVTFLFKDTSFNVSNPTGFPGTELSQPLDINAATTTDGIDEVVPISGSNTACRVNDLYLINGNTGSALALATGLSGTNIVQFSNGDILGINQTGVFGPLRGITTPASMLRVNMVTYWVTPDGVLMRREYANRPATSPPSPWIDEPLVYGVEDFQVQYVMDDGSISDNPSAGPNGIPGDADDEQANLMAVRQIRFSISVRRDGTSPGDEPIREVLTSTFSTRNLGYEAN